MFLHPGFLYVPGISRLQRGQVFLGPLSLLPNHIPLNDLEQNWQRCGYICRRFAEVPGIVAGYQTRPAHS